MSGFLDDVTEISQLGQRKLVVLYGKSGTGKTELGSTFPKTQLYLQLGDDGANTISKKEGIMAKRIDSVESLKGTLKELANKKARGYESVFIDTFSMLSNVWIDTNVISKKKKMTQQLWGDLKNDTEEAIRLCWELSLHTWVILSLHETTDVIEGVEDEIVPDVRPNPTKGARTYLEGMANYGIHTTKVQKTILGKEGTEKEVVKFAAHLGANPYYWTKLQVPKETKVPKMIINPTFDKLMEIISAQ